MARRKWVMPGSNPQDTPWSSIIPTERSGKRASEIEAEGREGFHKGESNPYLKGKHNIESLLWDHGYNSAKKERFLKLYGAETEK